MFFKAINLFHSVDFEFKETVMKEEALEEAMSKLAFIECEKSQDISTGWVNPFDTDLTTGLVRVADNAILMCQKTETRKVPAAAIKEEMNKVIKKELQRLVDSGQENPRLNKTEILDIKESVEQKLLLELPKSMSKYSVTYAYLDLKTDHFVVDGSSRNAAEGLSHLLRRSMEVKTFPTQVMLEPTAILTDWLKGSETIDVDNNLIRGTECTLRGVQEEKNTIKYKNQSLEDEHLRGHLDDDMTAADVQVIWLEHLTFQVNEEFQIKSIKLDKALKMAMSAETGDIDDESNYRLAVFDTEFQYMVSKFRDLVPALAGHFGGFAPLEDCMSGEDDEPVGIN